MSFRNVLVTGANRGIGLEFVKQLLALNPTPKNIIATTRKDNDDLNNLKSSHNNLHILNYDATAYDSCDKFTDQVKTIVGDDGLDLLINNAGMYVKADLNTFTPQGILQNVEINAVAPLFLTRSLLPLLKVNYKLSLKLFINFLFSWHQQITKRLLQISPLEWAQSWTTLLEITTLTERVKRHLI